MSSILTNNSAMVALQTLRSINKNLATTQNEISTGKSVATARDNAAVWAISKVMESDVKGFKAIQTSLSLGDSTVAVARQASETVSDLLTDMKEKIVAAQEENVDRAKIQTDIDALRDQITSIVGAAQINGLNLLSNQDSAVGSGTVDVLSSLDRSASGVATSDISVTKQDLGQQASLAGSTAGTAIGVSGPTAAANGGTVDYDLSTNTDAYGLSFEYSASIAGQTIAADYVLRDGETAADAASQLAARLNFALADAGVADISFSANGTDLTLTNNTATAVTTAAGNISVTTDGEAGGGLELLSRIDVTSSEAANASLTAIEGLIQTAIDSAAAFGSIQGRIETQSEFINGMVDALKSGIGTMVDADMEEASARLQALQVQQQLGVQALSIANQAPQTILSLFR
ncbi:flagellin [Lutimaribacter pacificus]|uniref:Flagellin n=1 Tax=Lutimaribacter pacificus TaxID=391948 RepID=A0A1H0EBL0_9RHOB|nr:flagellin [Lutimaribacter pacificus]SDN79837.1 flagellin [Lutimaribacter pacificus]SHK54482.1 flagellin [Lutimaribacter pacificus]